MPALDYPHDLVRDIELRDGRRIRLRPIRREDADIEQAFVRALSPHARYLRFQDGLQELSAHELRRLTDIDYHDMMAIIAVAESGDGEREVGVARYAADDDAHRICEFAIVVADDYCGCGLATAMMQHLIAIARERGFVLMYGDVLHRNARMLAFAAKLGFRCEPHPDDASLHRVVLDLVPH